MLEWTLLRERDPLGTFIRLLLTCMHVVPGTRILFRFVLLLAISRSKGGGHMHPRPCPRWPRASQGPRPQILVGVDMASAPSIDLIGHG